jgi:hypothetical protein
MRRSCPVAVAILLITSAGTPARGQHPPTPIRLVDREGRPVAGAVVGTVFSYDAEREPSLTPSVPSQARITDDRGGASLPLTRESSLCAIREDKGHPLVGAVKVKQEQLGKPITIVMYPACRVRFRVECAGFRELEEKYHAELGGPNWRSGAYAGLGGDDHPSLFVHTSSTTGEIEFLLPPGRFTIMAYGTDTDPVNRHVEIQPGHRERVS